MQDTNAFVSVFLEENAKLNLSAARTEKDVQKHVADSLAFSSQVPLHDGMKVLDVGSGGGFPGLVLAQAFPGASFTLLDSVQKKCDALRRMAKALGLTNVEVACGRAETLGHDPEHREAYDLVTARAVAALPTLLELCIPFAKESGMFAAFKGQKYEEELQAAKVAAETLGAELSEVRTYALDSEPEPRVLLLYKRNEPLSHLYPRKDGVPKKSPLS